MQSVFSVSEILPRKQLALLFDPTICAKKELCRTYRIPISFTDVDSFLTFIKDKQNIKDLDATAQMVFQEIQEGKIKYLIKPS